MSELRECPFCPDGGDPRVYCSSVAVIVHVECGKCGVTGDDFCESNDKKDEAVQRAIAAWNTRPADAVREVARALLEADEALWGYAASHTDMTGAGWQSLREQFDARLADLRARLAQEDRK